MIARYTALCGNGAGLLGCPSSQPSWFPRTLRITSLLVRGRSLVREGEVQRERAQELAEELVARTRRNAEELRRLVRKEIRDQLAALGISTRPRGTRSTTSAAKKTAATKKTGTPKKAPAKKAPAKKAVAKKAGPASGA